MQTLLKKSKDCGAVETKLLTLFVNVVNSRCEIFFKERKDGEEESLNPVSCESIS